MGRFSKKYSSFLSKEEIENIKEYVPHALKKVSHLVIIENIDKTPIAFMGVEGNKLEMLFIKNSERKKGFGKKIINLWYNTLWS